MKRFNYLASIMFFAWSHMASSAAPPHRPLAYTTATIENYTGHPVRISYFRPDPGFHGMHVIVHRTRIIADRTAARIMVTRKPITPPRCSYQLPNEQGEYRDLYTDSIEIPLSLELDTQTITLRAAKEDK